MQIIGRKTGFAFLQVLNLLVHIISGKNGSDLVYVLHNKAEIVLKPCWHPAE